MDRRSGKLVCLYLNNSPDPIRGELAKLGGGGKSLLTIWKSIPKFGWAPHAVLPAEGPMTRMTKELGVPFTIYPYSQPALKHPMELWRSFLAWRRIISSVEPAIIHSNSPDPARSVMLAAASLSKKLVCHIRWPLSEDGVPWIFRGLPKPAAFIFNSQALRDQIWPALSKYCPSSRVYAIHNAVDFGSFKPTPWPTGNPLRVGMIANLMVGKAHEDFLRMAHYLCNEHLSVEFWVIGEDTMGVGRRRFLEELAARLGISKRVRFLGHRSDMPDLLAKLHVTVLTSQIEPFGRVLIESMACGRPVVATRVGGIPEVVRDGETGYLVEAGDYVGMAKRVRSLLTDHEKWQAMSDAGIRDVKTRFSIERHARTIVKVYEEVLAK